MTEPAQERVSCPAEDDAADRSGPDMVGLLRSGGELIGVRAKTLLEVTLIKGLDSILSSDPAVVGAFSLRGTLIPVLDPFVLCSLTPRNVDRSIAAVLTDGTSMIALGVEGISGLRRLGPEAVQRLTHRNQDAPLIGHAILDKRMVHLIDTDRIFANTRLPRADTRLRRVASSASSDMAKFLTFSSGGVLYGLSAQSIVGTVPRQDITEQWMANRLLTGCIQSLGRRVPVVEPWALFDLGTPRGDQVPEFVVVRMQQDRVIALAVDEVCRIHDVPRAQVAAGQRIAGSRLLRGSIRDAGRDVFLLDTGEFLADPELNRIAELSDKRTKPAKPAERAVASAPEPRATTGTGTAATRKVLHERVRHLVFAAGSRFAAPITQVARIVEPPERRTMCRTSVPGVVGLVLYDDRTMPLVSLSAHLGLGTGRSTTQPRVLLIGPPDRRIALLVEGVDGIADSDWRSLPEARIPGGRDLVQLRHRGQTEVLDRLDLEEICKTIRAVWDKDDEENPARVA
ncbi:MAG: chemotaxis protein CheW [Roseicyclus sp.]